MSDFKSYKEESKKNYGRKDAENLSIEQLNTGCLMRIADSLEKIEKPYVEMIDALKWYKKEYLIQNEQIDKLLLSNRALKGVITRMKNKSK